MSTRNRQWRLARRPIGMPSEEDFRLEDAPVPTPGPGEVLVRTQWLSIDPYMRGRLRERASYAPAVDIGEVMVGAGVGEVVASQSPDIAVGDIVEGPLGWQTYAVVPATAVRRVDPALAPVSTALGVLGMPGLTAYFGLFEVARVRPGETVVVSAATGAVGAVAGQIARNLGCRVVGIAGTPEKVAYARRALGYDAALCHRDEGDLAAALAAACPNGVDVYFDNVGGPITDAVVANLAVGGRVAVCGQIALYNAEATPTGPRWLWSLIAKRARVEGFLVFDYAARYPTALAALARWLHEGRLEWREDVLEGLESAPRALRRLLAGENFGKQLVRVAP